MYNHNLEKIQRFGQEDRMLQFYLPLSVNVFLVSNQYFIINGNFDNEDENDDDYILKILNRSNGLVEASFKIHEDYRVKLYLDNFLITVDPNTRFLKCLNFKGDILHEITLDEKLKGSEFNVINKELCFELFKDKYFVF